jgi:hypothetical protein
VHVHCDGDCEVAERHAETPNRKACGELWMAEGRDGRKDCGDDEDDRDVSGDGDPAQDAAVLEGARPSRAEDEAGHPRLAPWQEEACEEDERAPQQHVEE